MSINLVTYANQTVTPTNDAIIYERAVDQNGIFHGCEITVSGNNVNITGGYGIVCGREFVIESESIPVTLAPSGTNDGRLYVRLDLADADEPIQLLTAQGNPLPALEQDADVNYVNGAYEMELATFTVGVSELTDVVETYETIIGSKHLLTGWRGNNYSVANNASVEVPIESSTRGFFLISSYNGTKAAIYAVAANAAGSCTSNLLASGTSGTGFVLTNGTNKITVKNNNIGALATIFYLTT